MIGDRADLDGGFFENLAPHRGFYRFSRLQKARQRRIHPLVEAGLPAQQAFFAAHREHDHDGVGAREVLRSAGLAIASVAGGRNLRTPAAHAAEAMARVPVEQAFRLPERADLMGWQRAFHRDRPKILKQHVWTRRNHQLPRVYECALVGDLARQDGSVIQQGGEIGAFAVASEQHIVAHAAQTSDLIEREQRLRSAVLRFQGRPVPADDEPPGLGVGHQLGDEGGIVAPCRQAIEGVDRVAGQGGWFGAFVWHQERIGSGAVRAPQPIGGIREILWAALAKAAGCCQIGLGGWRRTFHSPTGSGPEGSSPNENGRVIVQPPT